MARRPEAAKQLLSVQVHLYALCAIAVLFSAPALVLALPLAEQDLTQPVAECGQLWASLPGRNK